MLLCHMLLVFDSCSWKSICLWLSPGAIVSRLLSPLPCSYPCMASSQHMLLCAINALEGETGGTIHLYVGQRSSVGCELVAHPQQLPALTV